MAIVKEKKKEIFDKLKTIIENNSTVAFVNFRGLSVADATKLRKDLRGKDVGYFVAKKSILKKALEASGFGLGYDIDGEVAVAYGNETDPARTINEFSKANKGIPVIEGGIFENAVVEKLKMREIADIPARETLLGMFVNLINSPIQRFAIVLDQLAKK